MQIIESTVRLLQPITVSKIAGVRFRHASVRQRTVTAGQKNSANFLLTICPLRRLTTGPSFVFTALFTTPARGVKL
jgi:hypothetical protein